MLQILNLRMNKKVFKGKHYHHEPLVKYPKPWSFVVEGDKLLHRPNGQTSTECDTA